MNLYKIAWRNLWRNKRRTAITSASILFAVFFAVTMRSFQLGFYDHMIKNAIESYSGFLQVQHADFLNDPSLENTFTVKSTLLDSINKLDNIKAVVPRVETGALSSSGDKTKIALILGIDPIKEKELSNPENRLIRYRLTPEAIENLKNDKAVSSEIISKLDDIKGNSYTNTGTIAMDLELDKDEDKEVINAIAKASKFPHSYLKPNDDGVLVSERLAKYLKISIGDSLILYGVGYHGATAAGLFPVRGLIKMANPELDNKLVYGAINQVQYFANLGDNLTSIAINLDKNTDKEMKAMQRKLDKILHNDNLEVHNWKEFNKVLWQQIESDNNSGKIFLGLLYFIIFFGIFGTVLMMIFERTREFGVMISIGMQKLRLLKIMAYEMFFMGLLGVFSGVLLSIPLVLILHYNPVRITGDMAQIMEDMGFEAVMPLALPGMHVVWQAIIVGIMVVITCIVPIYKISRLKEIEALRA